MVIFTKGDEIPEDLYSHVEGQFGVRTEKTEVGPYILTLYEDEYREYANNKKLVVKERFDTRADAEIARKHVLETMDFLFEKRNWAKNDWEYTRITPLRVETKFIFHEDNEQDFTIQALKAIYQQMEGKDAEFMIEQFSWYFPELIEQHFSLEKKVIETKHWKPITDAH